MPVTNLRKNCKWCQAVRKDRNLLKRIYRSRKYTGKGETLLQISEAVGLPYHSLPNHCKHHQGLTDDDLSAAATERIAKQSAKQLIETNTPTNNLRQSIANQIAITLTSDDFNALEPEAKIKWLLRATKDMDDVKAKTKDQDMDWLKTMNAIRSGSVKPVIEGEVTAVATHEAFNPWSEEAPNATPA